MSKTLGILGGLGPMSSVYFYELITRLTNASCDQEHIDLFLSSRASTPDRTAYIIKKSEVSPLDIMTADAQRLISCGCDIIAIPCNTAHYFYTALQNEIDVPIINIVTETVKAALGGGFTKLGIMATEGTIKSGSYQHECEKYGIQAIIPDDEEQNDISSFIYNSLKKGNDVDMKRFFEISGKLISKGCDKIILGCTELSLIKRDHSLPDIFLDSLEVLAQSAIVKCGKEMKI